MSIGDAIREARRRRGITQGELAAAMGVGRTQVVNIERGRAFPSVQSLEEAADALRTTFVYRSNRGWSLPPARAAAVQPPEEQRQ